MVEVFAMKDQEEKALIKNILNKIFTADQK